MIKVGIAVDTAIILDLLMNKMFQQYRLFFPKVSLTGVVLNILSHKIRVSTLFYQYEKILPHIL